MTSTAPDQPDQLDADDVRARVIACPGVADVPGRGPNGVAVAGDEVEVHLVARYGVALAELGRTVDAALTPVLGGRRLRVVVDDVEDPTDPAVDRPAADGDDVGA